MSRGLNKVLLIGNLGKEPEIKTTKGGTNIAKFSVATSETWKDKTTGERKVITEWHRHVVCYEPLASAVCKPYLHKGSKVYIEGKIRTTKWQDKAGLDKYTTEIICDTLLLLDGVAVGSEVVGSDTPDVGSCIEMDDLPF